MSLKRLIKAIILATISLSIPVSLTAQNPPASTYQPGFWQPKARVDLNRPVAIRLINETNMMLDYDLTTNIEPSPEQISPGNTAILKGFALPVYILINPTDTSSTPNSSPPNLKYDVEVSQNNEILVKIRKVAPDTPGDSTLNLNEAGAIYIY
ncbi:MAG: hypothetical protein MUD14_18065 [Hydrococcus sp. Prado102]|jgi:hypothetical protein|nr:hypothetical protein [Hydrococcus sp. Prado102]